MLKKLLASVGIGAAKVDAVLENEQLMPGETFRAEIIVKGGDVAQNIGGLNMALMTQAEVESDDKEYLSNIALQTWKVTDALDLQPGEEKIIPFEATIHPETPITAISCPNNKSRVWLQTGLEIDMALDASDKDYLTVLPTPAMVNFLEAMEGCGYTLFQTDVEKGYLEGDSFRSVSGVYQELEFKPNENALFEIQEIEVSFVPTGTVTHALLEVDKRFSDDDTCLAITWDNDTPVEQLVEDITGLLS
ncbi:MAG: sporulation protein [Candidatus Electrothrix sp. YB6]